MSIVDWKVPMKKILNMILLTTMADFLEPITWYFFQMYIVINLITFYLTNYMNFVIGVTMRITFVDDKVPRLPMKKI